MTTKLERDRTTDTATTTDGEAKLRCSFCDQPQGEVDTLIAGPSVYICGGCVAICNEIIAAGRLADPTSGG